MAELTAKGAGPTSNSKAAMEKRVVTLKSRLERIDHRIKRGDPPKVVKILTEEKAMREAELTFLDLKLAAM